MAQSYLLGVRVPHLRAFLASLVILVLPTIANADGEAVPPEATAKTPFDADYEVCKYGVCKSWRLGATYAVRTVEGFLSLDLVGNPEVIISEYDPGRMARQLGKATTGGCRPAGGGDPDMSSPCLHDWDCASGSCGDVPLPAQVRELAIMRSSGEIASSAALPCVPGSAGDATCRDIGPTYLQTGYLLATGDASGAAFVRANVRPESFFCRRTTPGRSVGACRYRPFFQRVNVVPERFEAVWFNGDDIVGTTPRTVDYFYLRATTPSAVPSPIECLADYREKGPAAIPFYAE